MEIDLKRARKDLDEEGFFILPGVLDAGQLARVRAAIDKSIAMMRERGVSTRTAILDPNEANIRLYNLPEWNRVFMELLKHPTALALVHAMLGPHAIVSNFTGNIALPGSQPMKIHADQALVIPPPWHQCWAMNIVWCIDDVHESNGATRYIPGSHRWTDFSQVPTDLDERTVAFEAPAGSLIAMEGRVWHTSGANVSDDEQRTMLFAYYSNDFIRQQVNWEVCLSPATKAALNDEERALFGMGAVANARLGGELVRLNDGERPDILAASGTTE
jgi:fumagillin biosynthesis dioxygenase